MISVVVPVFNEEKTIKELHCRIVEAMGKQKDAFEIIFVNDGSTDNTEKEAKNLKPLKLISCAKNRGQTLALDTGMQAANGEIIVFIDADLQNDPEDILKLLGKISEGCDVAVGRRQNRQDAISRILFSRFANLLTRLALRTNIHDFGCGLKAYRSKFIKDFRLWGQMQIFLPAIAKSRGAKVCEVTVSHGLRKTGGSKIKFSNMMEAGINLLKVVFITRFSKK